MVNIIKKTGIILSGIVIFAIFFYVGISVTKTAPKVASFFTGVSTWEYKIQNQTVVYDVNGKEVGKIGYQKQYSKDFPQFLKTTVVAVEDRRFYQHNGLDTKGIGRALIKNIQSGSKAEGGSTITMQLARTLFLSQQKTMSRKIKEVFIASAIESKYTKDAILNMYLNEIYMGRGCSGMACAAESYFGKSVYDLNKGQITMLVGIISAPEFYSPEKNMTGIKQRQETVVNLLVEQNLISAQEGQEILAEKLNIRDYNSITREHPYYMTYLSGQLEKIVGASKLYQGGYKIYTTIDVRMQNAAETALTQNVKGFAARGISAKDAALVSIDPTSGEIRSMVGGANWSANQINMAVLPRQPGSAIKPLYYAAAFDRGIINGNTVLNNKKRDFGGGYTPGNYAASPSETTARQALIHSYNVASVEVLDQLGVRTAVDYLQSFGVSTIVDGDRNLALGLGGMNKGISPLEMASAYSVFPNEGNREQAYTLLRVEDASGKTIYTGETKSTKVIDSSTASDMDDILKDVVRRGTGTPAAVSISSGGKTGTTTDNRDLWYVGYTSELSTAVWVGNSDGTPVKGSTSGGGTAGPIWRDYMNRLIWNNVLREAPATTTKPRVVEPAAQPTTPEQVPNTVVPGDGTTGGTQGTGTPGTGTLPGETPQSPPTDGGTVQTPTTPTTPTPGTTESQPPTVQQSAPGAVTQ